MDHSENLTDQSYAGPSKIGNAFQKFSTIFGSGATMIFFAAGSRLSQFKGAPTEVIVREAEVSLQHVRTGMAMSAILGVAGAVWGWMQSAKAEQQHDALQEAVKDTHIENAKLTADMKWVERTSQRSAEQGHPVSRS